MNNNIKNVLIIIAIILVILLLIVLLSKNDNKDGVYTENDIEIEYSSGGGGPGLQHDIETITVKLSKKKSEITYENKVSKKISIDEGQYLELLDLINKKFYKSNKDLSNKGVMDGGTSSITIKNNNTGKSYTVGGYGVDDEIFEEVEDKIIEVIGEDTIDNFRENELKNYFES